MCRHGRLGQIICFTLHPWSATCCIKSYFMGIVLTASLQLRAPAHICQSTTAPAFPSPQDPVGQNLLFHLYDHLWPNQTVLVGYWREPAWTCRGEKKKKSLTDELRSSQTSEEYHIQSSSLKPKFCAECKYLLVALFSSAIQEGIQSGPEVFTDLLLHRTSKDCTMCHSSQDKEIHKYIQSPDLPWTSCEGMHQLHRQRAEVCDGTKTRVICWCFPHFAFIFGLYWTLNRKQPTRVDLCWPSQTLCAWLSLRHGPWALHHRQSWWHSPSQNALPASTQPKKKVRQSLALHVCLQHTSCSPCSGTFAKRVLPVPGGPYMRMFLYRPWFCRVFLVAMATSRTRSSREGWGIEKKKHTFW